MLGELREGAPCRIGPYRILAHLGGGGVGEVYLGADVRPRPAGDGGPRLAAVRIVGAGLLGDFSFRDRFEHEIATAGAIEDRFVARVLAGETATAQPWMATEYIAGPTLERAVEETGPLPLETVRELGLGLVRALRAMRHAGVPHGGLTPAGVLLGADGPRVTGFVRGGRDVAPASDVFSLASVLCYAATGESSFDDAQRASLPAELRELIEDRPGVDAPAGAEWAGAMVWPADVRELVARYEESLARVVAAAGPLAEPVPALPDATPVHRADTDTDADADTPVEPAPEPAALPRSRRGTAVAFVAAALAMGVLGAFGLRALQDVPEREQPSAAERAKSEARTVWSLSGVDKYGGGQSRYFPVDYRKQPAGWEPWTAKMKGRPWGCALNAEFLVCRMFDGGLEALKTKDGSPQWKAASAAPNEEPVRRASGGMRLPGGATNPVVYDDLAISAEGGMVRGRALADGKPRWERPFKAGGAVSLSDAGGVMVREGVVFLTSSGEGTRVHAFDAVTGKRLWERAMPTYDGPVTETAEGSLAPYAFTGGRLVAGTASGLMGFDARTGKATSYTAPGGGRCTRLRTGWDVRCVIDGKDAVSLDKETLQPLPDEFWSQREGEAGEPGNDLPERELVEGAGAAVHRLAPDARSERMELTALSGIEGPLPAPTRTVGVFPGLEEGEAGQGGSYVHSRASVFTQWAAFLDNQYLYSLPLDWGTGRRSKIDAAPGNRATSGLGDGIEGQVWAPELLSTGRVLVMVFHDGTVSTKDMASTFEGGEYLAESIP